MPASHAGGSPVAANSQYLCNCQIRTRVPTRAWNAGRFLIATGAPPWRFWLFEFKSPNLESVRAKVICPLPSQSCSGPIAVVGLDVRHFVQRGKEFFAAATGGPLL